MFYLRLGLVVHACVLMSVMSLAQPNLDLILKGKESNRYFQRFFADSAFIHLKISLDDAIKKRDKLPAALCLRKMGRICYQLACFPQALDYHLQADKLFNESGQKALQAQNLDDIGMVFLRSKQPAIARQHYEAASTIYNAIGDDRGIATIHGRIGHLLIQQHHLDSGFYFLHLALNEYTQLEDAGGIARIFGQLGNAFEDEKKYDSAFSYFRRSQLLSEKAGDTTAYIEAMNNVGDIFRKTGRYKDALALAWQTRDVVLRTGELFHLGSVYRDLAKTHHLLGNDDSAYHFQRIRQTYMQTIYSRENSTQLAVLKTMYDVEKQNSEIARLKAARRAQVAFVIIGILLLALGTLVISRQRLRIRNAGLLNQQEKDVHLAQKATMELQQHKLRQELELKSRELTTHTLNIIQKNQFLEKLEKGMAEVLKDERREQRKSLKQLQLEISQNINHGQHWDQFHGIFDQVHESFFARLKAHCDHLTRPDLRLIALLKMNLGSAEIATLLGVSQESLRVIRYRLRKKLNLQQGEGLAQFIQSI